MTTEKAYELAARHWHVNAGGVRQLYHHPMALALFYRSMAEAGRGRELLSTKARTGAGTRPQASVASWDTPTDRECHDFTTNAERVLAELDADADPDDDDTAPDTPEGEDGDGLGLDRGLEPRSYKDWSLR